MTSIDNRFSTFYTTVGLLFILLAITCYEFVSRFFYDIDCNIFQIKVKLAIQSISVLSFVMVSNIWINKIVNEFFS